MKSIIKATANTLILGALMSIGQIAVADTVETTTTTASGDIADLSGDSFVIRSESGPATYHYSKRTTVVDENGNALTIDSLKAGVPATVYYSREGDNMIVNRVVVKRPAAQIEKHESTTTTTTREHEH
jgi:hypothetical protein